MSPTIASDIWITKEGQQMEIKTMASSHLLAAIHYVERNRFMNAAEVFSDMNFDEHTRLEMTEYYLQWPIQYDNLVTEAQKRGLIYRGVEGTVQKRIKK